MLLTQDSPKSEYLITSGTLLFGHESTVNVSYCCPCHHNRLFSNSETDIPLVAKSAGF